MSMRVLNRIGARELTVEEFNQVQGAQVATKVKTACGNPLHPYYCDFDPDK